MLAGPPWSGAGVGVGILSGTIMFEDVEESQKRSSQIQRFHAHPKLFKSLEYVFQRYVCFSGIYLCLKIINNYQRFIKIPPSHFPFLFKTLRDINCFLAHQHLKINMRKRDFFNLMFGSFQRFSILVC